LLRRFIASPTFKENLPIVALVWLYVAAVYTVQSFLGVTDRFRLFSYSHLMLGFGITFVGLFLAFHNRNNSWRTYVQLRYAIGLAVVLIHGALFQSAFASFKQTITLINAFDFDTTLMWVDYYIHLGHHPWRIFASLASIPGFVRTIDVLYMFWFVILFSFVVWMALSKRRVLRLQFLTSTFFVWTLLGSSMGALLSSAGPCYYSHVSRGPNPYAALMDYLHGLHQSQALFAVGNQAALWNAYTDGVWLPFGGISAMPSIHLAMTVLFAALLFNVHRVLGALGVLYICIIQIGSVMLGWHYAVDGYVAIILALPIWKLTGLALRANGFMQTWR
jgi:hypothetical protein